MKTFTCLLGRVAAVLALLATVTGAQGFGLGNEAKASAKLYTRVDGDRVRAAIQIRIEPGWHLYHSELGHPDAVGTPTTIEMSGEGITWSEPRFPEPHRTEQPLWDAWILDHSGKIFVHVAGVLEEGATADDVTAKIAGQTCEDDGTCILYGETVKTRGEGTDEAFADFPEALLDGLAAVAAIPDDELGSGRADATAYVRTDGRNVSLAIEIEIDEKWHLYHTELGHPDAVGMPTTVAVEADGVEWGEVRFPEPHEYPQPEWDAFILGHEGRIVLRADGTLADGASAPGVVKVSLSGLTCEEGGQCIPYRETAYARGKGTDELFAALPAETADEGRGDGESDDEAPASSALGDGDGLTGFLLAAVFWGFITLLMPCTYPMIPITISFFTKQADQREGSALPLALAYGFGIVAIFVLIGVTVGGVIVIFAQHWLTNLVIGAAFVYFALVLFGVVDLNPPRFLLDLASKASAKGGLVGVFLMGATLVITSFTCTAPFVGALLGSAGADARPMSEVALGMGVFGLTMAIPFVVLSLVPGMIKNIPNSGRWMNTFKVTMGFVELAAAFKFFSNADLVLQWDVLSRELFLLLWVLIFGAAALYLFGLMPGKREKARGGRLAAAVGALAICGYSAWGMAGKPIDEYVMTPLVPNYSGGRFMPEWYDYGTEWVIVKDDYDAALEQARAEEKLVLVNFTGFT